MMGIELVVGCCVGVLMLMIWVVRNLNWWLYERKLDSQGYKLPPGDLGWPFLGNMRSFLRAFKSSNLNHSSTTSLKGLYKVHMFGNPSIIVTAPEAIRKVLTDDGAFKQGWPSSAVNLMGKKSFVAIPEEEHKWLRKLTAVPINGPELLTVYTKYIEENVIKALDKWANMGQIELLPELGKVFFAIIMQIFLSSEGEHVGEALQKEYTLLKYGVRAMAVNLPGFAYYNALKARKNIAGILQQIVSKRREKTSTVKKDLMEALLDAEDENGRKLDDEYIIDLLIMYLNAGHESTAHTTMWTTLHLQKNPDIFKKAKAEQEEIVRNRPTGQKGLTLEEVRKMDYLNKVIDETLRLITFSVFREAKKDVSVGGYTIPKGWKALVWFRSVHYNPETWPEPNKFDPSRWNDFKPKPGNYVPFGGGRRLCPGNNLAKLEISVFLHYFLLNYELEIKDPDCPLVYLPVAKPKDNGLGRIRFLGT